MKTKLTLQLTVAEMRQLIEIRDQSTTPRRPLAELAHDIFLIGVARVIDAYERNEEA